MEPERQMKSNFIWNAVGSVFESALSLLLLLLVNRMAGEASGGVFTFAFSHSQLLYYLATLETRPIQSTDVNRKYPFSLCFTLRLVSCGMMLMLSLGHTLFFMDGDPFRKRIILYLCLYRALEALLDVFAAMFQQHGRIEYSGKVSAYRIPVTILAFALILFFTGNLEWACLSMPVITAGMLLTYNLAKWREFPDAGIRLRLSGCRELLQACLPLFVSVFVMLYISNAPKYAIDTYCTDVVQNRYSILFMPAFVINLFSQFIFRPLLTPMASLWTGGETGRFTSHLTKMMLGILGITAVCIGGAWFLGIPVLSALYHADLSGERSVLIWVMVYGGLNAVNILLYNMVAVIRRQKWLLLVYPVSAAAVFFLASPMVQARGMAGGVLASVITMALLDGMLAAVVLGAVRMTRSGKADRNREGESRE